MMTKETQDNTFTGMWLIFAITLVSIISATVILVSYNDNKTLIDMVAKGADPIKAKCSLNTGLMQTPTCVLTSK